MLRVALTGGIATGKSYCLSKFAELGAATIDADVLAREAVAPRSPGLAEVVARFGRDVLLPDGSLDRAAVARVVFSDAAARADLEAIVHPRVYTAVRDWYRRLPPSAPMAVADIPLLYETGHTHEFDRVVVAACSASEQLRRLMARDKLDEREARARLAAQWPIEKKAARADYVISTEGTFADTEAQVRAVFAKLQG